MKLTAEQIQEIRARVGSANEVGLTGMHVAAAVYYAYLEDIPALLDHIAQLEAEVAALIYKNSVLESDNYNLSMNLDHVSQEYATLTAGIPTDELEQIAQARAEGRLVILNKVHKCPHCGCREFAIRACDEYYICHRCGLKLSPQAAEDVLKGADDERD